MELGHDASATLNDLWPSCVSDSRACVVGNMVEWWGLGWVRGEGEGTAAQLLYSSTEDGQAADHTKHTARRGMGGSRTDPRARS